MEKYEREEWYIKLRAEEKYIFSLIIKYHNYFCSQDIKYRKIVRILKVVVLLFALLSTVVLGLNSIVINTQLCIGLLLSASITFLTALSSYFSFEEYWMRNISIHIKLNILRDNFIYDIHTAGDCFNRLEHYKNELDIIQYSNIEYWKRVNRNI